VHDSGDPWRENLNCVGQIAALCLLASPAFTQDNVLTPLQHDPKVEKMGVGYAVFKQTKESVWQ
jgi:hypothetical protein